MEESPNDFYAITMARYIFSKNYIESKGWDCATLTPEQIMEIRNQDGWKNADRE